MIAEEDTSMSHCFRVTLVVTGTKAFTSK